MSETPAHQPEPCFRKRRPTINPEASRSTSATELMNRGSQLLIELDRQHKRLHEAVEDALKPEPQVWRAVRAAKTDYDAAYAELKSLSKRLNQLIQIESHELVLPSTPLEMAIFGDVVSIKTKRRK